MAPDETGADPEVWVVRPGMLHNHLHLDKDQHLEASPVARSATAAGEGPGFMHRLLRPLLVTAQVFALMPVQGVTGRSTSSLRFRWCSLRVAYCGLMLVLSALMLVTNVLKLLHIGLSFDRTSSAVFFCCHFATTLLFLQLARDWPGLMRHWEGVERNLWRYGHPPTLAKTAYVTSVSICVVAIVEHALANGKSLWASAERCGHDWAVSFFKCNYAPFTFVPYAHWKTAIFATVNLVATFSWSYMDLFIMLISMSINARFNQLNAQLRDVRGKVLPESTWRQFREDYNNLSFLTKTVDACISKIVLVSFGSNLYFICLQLFNSMKPRSDFLDYTYFYWSFGYLLLKTCAVSLCAAGIYERSKEPKAMLYAVPHKGYNIEVQRFLMQVISDDVVLTGLNFFSVTRTLLLTVAGTIVTYEIVLVQFSNLNDDDSHSHNATSTTASGPC